MAYLPVADAMAKLLAETPGPDPEKIPWRSVAGRVLFEPVRAAWDDPAFDRSSMDGYALGSLAPSSGDAFEVVEVVMAGDVPARSLGESEAAKVMTGAPVPVGTRAVVPVEDCRAGGGRVATARVPVAGENIRRRGENCAAGTELFLPGRVATALDAAVGMGLGVAEATVARRPSATILATGTELVEAGVAPAPGQIVNTNGPLLSALWTGWGGEVLSLRSVRDNEEALRSAVREGLDGDFLVLSGGVSMGDRDLVPPVLEENGVRVVFHKVAMKPGKPIFFGVKGKTAVLGLPGNPVSAFVGATLFLEGALRKRTGRSPRDWSTGRLAEGRAVKGKRTLFEPGLQLPDGTVRLLPHMGSADLPAWREAGILVELPWEKGFHPAGAEVRFFPLQGRESRRR